MNRRSMLLTTGAAALSACATLHPRRQEFALASDLDAAIGRAMAQLGAVPGLSVAVYTREGTYARGFGVTDVETGERANADTAFYIGSSTKPLTALALATLHQRGAFDLDATLTGYAPQAPFPDHVRAGEVTFRHMLSHTSGIQNQPLVLRVGLTGQHDPETLWRLLTACAPNADAPLGHFEYVNDGYNIATVLTDRGLGVTWQDLLARELFVPAGMTRSTAAMSRAQNAGWSLAKPHVLDGDGRMQRVYLEKNDQTMHSAGGVVMSANDALRLLELMIEDGRVGSRQIVPAEVVQASRTPLAELSATFGEYSRERYGLGWYHGRYRDELMLHNFGAFTGARAHLSYMPERGMGVAAFVNDDTVCYELVDAIANYIYDATGGRDDAGARFDAALEALVRGRDAGVQEIQTDRARRAGREWLLSRPMGAYAGAYENETWGRIEVGAGDGGLDVRFGALQARAEPFVQPDSIRLELIPRQGVPALFTGEGPAPAALVYRGLTFARV